MLDNIYLEGRGWMKIPIDKFGAKIKAECSQEEGYFYIYQLFTTCFIEFDNLKILGKCIDYLNEHEKMWDYDPITILKSGKHKDFMDLIKIKL